jgi:protein-S-isoprenylcysteine O-methyltransferase Ste14
VLALGVGLRVAAVTALRQRFVTDIRVDGPLVASGIYRWLRHPSEIGLLLMGVGTPLLLGASWSSACGGLCLVPISWWRMRREDAAFSRYSDV